MRLLLGLVLLVVSFSMPLSFGELDQVPDPSDNEGNYQPDCSQFGENRNFHLPRMQPTEFQQTCYRYISNCIKGKPCKDEMVQKCLRIRP